MALERKISGYLFLLLVPALLPACASLKSAQTPGRELVLEREWTRQTTVKDFLLYRAPNRMTPLFFESLVIQGNAIDGIAAYDRVSGARRWGMKIENGVEGGAALADGRLYFGASDGTFYCLDARDGKIQWTFPVLAETLAQPTIADGVVYVQTGADIVYALDAGSGKQLWIYNRQTSANLSVRASTRPVIDGSFVYVGFADGFLVALDRQGGTLKWEKKLGRNRRFNDIDSTPVVDGEMIYVSSYDGNLFALDRATAEIRWEVPEGGYTPVTVGTSHIYYSTTSGSVMALEKATGRTQWSLVVRGIATQPVVHEGFLLFGESEGGLIAADARTGSVLARFSPGRGMLATPAVHPATGEVFFISNSANLYSMRLGFQRRLADWPWRVSKTAGMGMSL